MPAPGEHDLQRMLASLQVERRPGEYTFVTGESAVLAAVAHAIIHEQEGPTYVVTVADAADAGIETEFVGAWLTLTVWSSLEAVGLTAAFSTVLAAAGVPCNVLAGYHHDHLIVPADRVDDAIQVLAQLTDQRT